MDSNPTVVKFKILSKAPHDQLVKLMILYEREAERCAAAQSYYGACILLGAALEGALLVMCSTYPDEVAKLVNQLPKNERPKKSARVDRWDLYELAPIAAKMGWLPTRETPRDDMKIGDWIHFIRELRDLIHPGRHFREIPDFRLGKRHYNEAKEIFDLAMHWLRHKLEDDLGIKRQSLMEFAERERRRRARKRRRRARKRTERRDELN